ncbi:MAG: hypothetical protein QX191_05300, partial [Methylococcaceae bacterium]
DVGDSVNVKIIASGCGPSGHEGHVYVDSGAGMTNLPGLNISAAGPANVSAPGTVTYTYNYKNAGTTPITGTKISIVSPQDNSLPIKNLTFNAISGISGCTTPAAGTAGTVSCNSIGVLNAGASGSFQATWNVSSPAIGPINHATYSISGDSSATILGPLVQTKITSLPLVDLAVSKTNNLTALTWSQHTIYTVTVTNNGPATIPSGWTVADSPPGTLTNVTWTCSGSSVTCPVSSGSGAINVTGASTFPSGGLLTYIVTADVVSGSGPGTVNNTVSVNVPSTVADTNVANNTAADVDNVSNQTYLLTLNSAGDGYGTVNSSPAGLNCDTTTCSTVNSSFSSDSQVILYATAKAGSIFAGWSVAGCSGTAASCTVTMS